MLQPGETLDGYRLIRPIGSGGFGEVWLCRSEALGDFRALKFIPATNAGCLEKEFESLGRYRTAATKLRSPAIMPIEHVNRRTDGLFYVMPLADGYGMGTPTDQGWFPLTLKAVIERQRAESTWFAVEEIRRYITPILHALQLLSDAGLVHRDVKPDNILFVNGTPCLADISLLGADTSNLTRRGTPGFSAPTWFVESGGHPDMYGTATTFYALLTGNPPDKLGRAAFRWPPQGELSLSSSDREEWLAAHRVISRAIEDRPAERFRDFKHFAQALGNPSINEGRIKVRNILPYSIGAIALILLCFEVLTNLHQRNSPSERGEVYKISAKLQAAPSQELPSAPRIDSESVLAPAKFHAAFHRPLRDFNEALTDARQQLLYPIIPTVLIEKPVERAIDQLSKMSGEPRLTLLDAANRVEEIKAKLGQDLSSVPKRLDHFGIAETVQHLEAVAEKIRSTAQSENQHSQYKDAIRPLVEKQINDLQFSALAELHLRLDQMGKLAIAFDPLLKRLSTQNDTQMSYQETIDKYVREAPQWKRLESARLATIATGGRLDR